MGHNGKKGHSKINKKCRKNETVLEGRGERLRYKENQRRGKEANKVERET